MKAIGYKFTLKIFMWFSVTLPTINYQVKYTIIRAAVSRIKKEFNLQVIIKRKKLLYLI